MEKAGEQKEFVPFKEKIAFSIGDFAFNLFWMTFIYFQSFFYTDIFGLPASVVGTMFLITKLWDAVNDPIMGIIADRTETKWGKYRPFILWLAIPLGVVGTAAFFTPPFGMTGKIIYAYVTYTLMMMCYTAINIPYSSLMGVISPNSKERTKISSYRFAFAFAGGIFIQALTLPLLNIYGGGDHSVMEANLVAAQNKFAQEIVIEEKGQGAARLDVIINQKDIKEGGLFAIFKKGTKKKFTKQKAIIINTEEFLAKLDTNYKSIINKTEERHFLSRPDDHRLAFIKGFQQQSLTLQQMFPDIDFNNTEVRIRTINQRKGYFRTVATYALIAVIILFITFAGTNERVQPPKNQQTTIKRDIKNVISTKPWVIVALINLFSFIMIVVRNGSIMYYFTYYLDKQLIAGAFMMIMSIFNILGALATDWLTELLGGKKNTFAITMGITTGLLALFYFLPPSAILTMFILQIIIGFLTGPQAAITWAMYADTADYSEWKDGTRATGLFFSASTFAQKMGVTMGGAIIGWVLAIFGYQAHVVQTPEAIVGIKLLMSFIPAIACLISVVFVLFYDLNDEKMEMIGKELEARRAE